MTSKGNRNRSWTVADLSNEYEEGWSNFCEEETIKCFRKCMDFLKELNGHIKIMGEHIPLKEYRVRLQRLIEYLHQRGVLIDRLSCMGSKVSDVIREKGLAKAILHLTQTIIRFLAQHNEIYAKRYAAKRRKRAAKSEDDTYVF